MVGHVVNSMITHVSLHAILERVMRDPGYCGGNFAQIKHLLKGEVLHHKADAVFGCLPSLPASSDMFRVCGPVSFSLHCIAYTIFCIVRS